MTKLTMRLGTPRAVSRFIASGMAASEEVVVKARRMGSRSSVRNRRTGTRAQSAIGSKTVTAKTASAR